MLMFTLSIAWLTTLIYLDSWIWYFRSYAILLFTALDFTSITSHIYNWVLFLLWLHLFILSGVISSLVSSTICSSISIYRPGEFMLHCPIFSPFHTVHGVLKARILKRFAIPFSSGPCFVRTLHFDPSILDCPYTTWLIVSLSWTRLWSMWSVWFSVIVVFILSALWPIRRRTLWNLPDGRDWLWGKLSLVLMGRSVLKKSLIQFSFDGLGCVPSLLFDLRSNYDGGNEDNGNLFQKVLCTHCRTQCPRPCIRPQPTHAFTGNAGIHTGKSGSVSYGVTAPFSWALVHTRFCLYPPKVCFPSSV